MSKVPGEERIPFEEEVPPQRKVLTTPHRIAVVVGSGYAAMTIIVILFFRFMYGSDPTAFWVSLGVPAFVAPIFGWAVWNVYRRPKLPILPMGEEEKILDSPSRA